MTEEERKAHALRIAQEALEDLEYCYVYEDEELEYVDEEDQLAIYSYITANTKVSID